MKIVTFNVNGLRSIKEHYWVAKRWSFDRFLDSFDADVICFQETKINKPEMVDHELAFPKNYHAYFAFPRVPRKTGYAGVTTYCRNGQKHPVRSFRDDFTLGDARAELRSHYSDELLDELDSEARVLMTDHASFVLFNVYFPNDAGDERARFRERFYSALALRMDALVAAGRNVIVACDLNTTCDLADHCDYVKPYLEQKNVGTENAISEYIRKAYSPSSLCAKMETLRSQPDEAIPAPSEVPMLIQDFFMTKPSRVWAYHMFHHRLPPYRWIDCYRQLHPGEPERFSCWNTQMSARVANYGTRIDYIIAMGQQIASDPQKHIKASDQMYTVMGSDHCPVWAQFEFEEVPWDKPAAAEKERCRLRKQPRLEAFFKPKPKEHRSAEAQPIINDAHHPPPPAKKMRPLVDTTLPFGKARLEAAPLCSRHGEPGKELTVNKAGANKGRKFYICSRPVGHPTDSGARCDFFKWKK